MHSTLNCYLYISYLVSDRILKIFFFWLYLWGGAYMCHRTCVEIRSQLGEVDSPLPTCGFKGLKPNLLGLVGTCVDLLSCLAGPHK